MTLIELTKINRKQEQVSFVKMKDSQGVISYADILPEDLDKDGQTKVDLIDSTKTYVGESTRYDYETTTGLISDGEYGEDGITKGKQMVQISVSGKVIVLPEELIENDTIDTENPTVAVHINNKLEIPDLVLGTYEMEHRSSRNFPKY